MLKFAQSLTSLLVLLLTLCHNVVEGASHKPGRWLDQDGSDVTGCDQAFIVRFIRTVKRYKSLVMWIITQTRIIYQIINGQPVSIVKG